MNALKTAKTILAAALTAGALMVGSVSAHHTPETRNTLGEYFHYTLDVRSPERQEAIRQEILRYLDGQIDSIYNWGGFGKLAKWDVRRWRKFEIREMDFHELLRFASHIKEQEWGYQSAVYSIKELARSIYGELQWREAQWRPEHHERNEFFTSPYTGDTERGFVVVETNADHYRGFYREWIEVRYEMIIGELKASTRWIGANWIDFGLHPDIYRRNAYLHATETENRNFTNRLGYNSQRQRDYFGDTLLVEHLEYHRYLTRDERIIHYNGEFMLHELFE